MMRMRARACTYVARKLLARVYVRTALRSYGARSARYGRSNCARHAERTRLRIQKQQTHEAFLKRGPLRGIYKFNVFYNRLGVLHCEYSSLVVLVVANAQAHK